MTRVDDDHHVKKLESDWPKIAVALIVAGVVLPPILASVFPSIWLPFAEAIGLSVAAAGFALFVVSAQRGVNQQGSVLASDMRSLANRVERCTSLVETMRNEVTAVEKTVDGERLNLGMVAAGLGEMRQIVRLERVNLGLMAEGLDEIRNVLRTFEDALQTARSKTHEAVSRLDDVATQTRATSTKQDDLAGEIGVQRVNLGMVAGALDDLRRLTAGVHLFDARQAAFEDALIKIADRIDRIDGDDRPSAEVSESATNRGERSVRREAAFERGDE